MENLTGRMRPVSDPLIPPASHQTFDRPDGTGDVRYFERLLALLNTIGFEAILIGSADVHLCWAQSLCVNRLAKFFGFTGSAGTAVVTSERAFLFVDGRYTEQAVQETDSKFVEVIPLFRCTPFRWIANTLSSGTRVGFDPRLHSVHSVRQWKADLEQAGIRLSALESGVIETIDDTMGGMSFRPVIRHDVGYSGQTFRKKIDRYRSTLCNARIDAAVMTCPEAIAWLLNIRGSDRLHVPVANAFAILPAHEQEVELYVMPDTVPAELASELAPEVKIMNYQNFSDALGLLGTTFPNARIAADEQFLAEDFHRIIEEGGARIIQTPEFASLARSIKTAAEVKGAREAHRRDGLAMVRFLSWWSRQSERNCSEIEIIEAIEHFRRSDPMFRDIAFDSIAGAGPNGALPHYRATRSSNRNIRSGDFIVVDSGGQYPDGTTDLTRTLTFGEPTTQMRTSYTRVLEGMISLSRTQFPKGTTGAGLDAIARAPLWEAGLEFDHGTGHGVGSYLNVHEGPGSISRSATHEIHCDQIFSIEPGHYVSGKFGVRIENLVRVEAHPNLDGFLKFETLSFVPIETCAIDHQLISPMARSWLNRYHIEVENILSPLLNPVDKKWLQSACKPI